VDAVKGAEMFVGTVGKCADREEVKSEKNGGTQLEWGEVRQTAGMARCRQGGGDFRNQFPIGGVGPVLGEKRENGCTSGIQKKEIGGSDSNQCRGRPILGNTTRELHRVVYGG